jgi:hypothetical protein
LLLFLISTPVFPESYEQSEHYKNYQNLPEKYKTPGREQQYRKAWEAEMAVKSLPCKHGETVQSYLDRKSSVDAIEDLGWKVFPRNDGFEVERLMLLNGTKKLSWRWNVNTIGIITPANDKAMELTKWKLLRGG